jgi:hypothetical protein
MLAFGAPVVSGVWLPMTLFLATRDVSHGHTAWRTWEMTKARAQGMWPPQTVSSNITSMTTVLIVRTTKLLGWDVRRILSFGSFESDILTLPALVVTARKQLEHKNVYESTPFTLFWESPA